jgi:hypothetical protein
VYILNSSGREEAEMRPELFKMYTDDMVRLHEYIANVDPNDHATWAHVARDASAAYAAWSRRLEPTPGPLADASRTLARSAQLRASQSTPRPPQMPSMANTTALILAQARKGKNAAAEALLLRQLSQMTVSIHDAAKASGEARVARETVVMMRQRLTVVRDSYAATVDRNATTPGPNDYADLSPELRDTMRRNALMNGKGSPVPTKLTPPSTPAVDVTTTRKPATPQRDGHER